jgi:casein kinase II subunit alpha
MSHVYADVNQEMPRSYWDYLSVDISWGLLEDYEVVRRIGEFKFRIGNLQLIPRSLYTK